MTSAAVTSAAAPGAPSVRRRYPAAPLVGMAVAVFRPAQIHPEVTQQSTHQAQPEPSQFDPSQPEPLRGEVLLVRRKNPPRAGEWGLPGGMLHLGEELATGVQRELWEECGIRAILGGIFGAFEPIHYDDEGRVEYHYVVIEYWASYHSGTARAAADAAAVAWIDMDTLADLNIQSDSQQMIQTAYGAWQDWTAYGTIDRS